MGDKTSHCCCGCFEDRLLTRKDFALNTVPLNQLAGTLITLVPGDTLVSMQPAHKPGSVSLAWNMVAPHPPVENSDSFVLRYLFGVQSHGSKFLGSHNYLEVAKTAGKRECLATLGVATYDPVTDQHVDSTLDQYYFSWSRDQFWGDSILAPFCYGTWVWGRPQNQPPLKKNEVNEELDIRSHVYLASGQGQPFYPRIEMLHAGQLVQGTGIGIQFLSSSLTSPQNEIRLLGATVNEGSTLTKTCMTCARFGRYLPVPAPTLSMPMHALSVSDFNDLFNLFLATDEFGDPVNSSIATAVSVVSVGDLSSEDIFFRQVWHRRRYTTYDVTYEHHQVNYSTPYPHTVTVTTGQGFVSIWEIGTLGLFRDHITYETTGDRLSYGVYVGNPPSGNPTGVPVLGHPLATVNTYSGDQYPDKSGLLWETPPDVPLQSRYGNQGGPKPGLVIKLTWPS
jgi:hypothetical protein